MPKISVPEAFRRGVREISELDDSTIEKICGLLRNLTPEEPTALVVSAFSSLAEVTDKKEKLREIGKTIVALYGVRANGDLSVDDLIDQTIASMEWAGLDWKIPDDQVQSFRKNLSKLLEVESFALRSKVNDLRTEDERVFCGARILTDLRPVFGANIGDGPKAMVVVHLLKLGFHRAGRRSHEDIYVSLDEDDLDTLKAVIERALSKARSLKPVVPALPIVGVEKEGEK